MNIQPLNPVSGAPVAPSPVVTLPNIGVGNAVPQPSFQAQPMAVPQPQSNAQLPVVLVILDGWGIAPPSRGNAISLARTPHMNQLMMKYPTVTLHASGEVVGLPWAEMGNSEVGHLNIGSGKIIYQNLPLINKAISDGSFFKNEAFLDAMRTAKERKSKLHLMGMVSDGGIHSSQDHLFALLEMCRDQGLQDVYVHGFLDGRDTARDAALGAIAKLETKMRETGVGKIATLAGRFWAMDRDNHWDRTEKAYNAMRYGKSDHVSDSPLKAIEISYQQSVFDEEFFPTVIIREDGLPVTTIDDGDVMIFFNFRADRAREITKAFVLPSFQKFNRGKSFSNLMFVSMTEYEKNLPLTIAFLQDHVRYTVSRVVSDAGYRQLHIAETEKYAHVTFFFNGGSEDVYPNEDRVLIPSPRVTSYDQTPAMSVGGIADRMAEEIKGGKYQFMVANFANADMVGHTGNLSATIQAIEATDAAIGKVADAVFAVNGTLIVTADHGNAEELVNLQTGEIDKEHSTNPVPFIMANSVLQQQRMMWPQVLDGDLSRMQPVGVLSDAAPTVLQLLGLPIPSEMTSRSLIR
jgi:2,3-bisphosphoglycerate-independent phosphoglycerate mutase